LDRAEVAYVALLQLDPEDDIAFTALEELRKAAGKHEELVEMLLEKSETSESATERGRALNQIGHLYMGELDDREQAAFAFARGPAPFALRPRPPRGPANRRLRRRRGARRRPGHEARAGGPQGARPGRPGGARARGQAPPLPPPRPLVLGEDRPPRPGRALLP